MKVMILLLSNDCAWQSSKHINTTRGGRKWFCVELSHVGLIRCQRSLAYIALYKETAQSCHSFYQTHQTRDVYERFEQQRAHSIYLSRLFVQVNTVARTRSMIRTTHALIWQVELTSGCRLTISHYNTYSPEAICRRSGIEKRAWVE